MLERIPRRGDIVRAETSAGIARMKGWVTRVIQGEVLAITEKSMLVRGCADVYADDGCMICGRTLTKFTSRAVYIGPTCAKNNNLFYPTDEELTPEQRDEIRARIRATWKGEEWMPRAWTKFTVIEEAHVAPEGSIGPSEQEKTQKIEQPERMSRHQMSTTLDAPAPPVEKVDVRFSIETLATTKSQGTYIVCRSRFEHKEKCQSINPRTWDPEIAPFPPGFPRPGAWVYPVSAVLAHQLKTAFEGCNRRGTPQFAELLKQSATIAEAGEIKTQDEASLPEIPVTKTRAWAHQTRAYHFVQKIWGD